MPSPGLDGGMERQGESRSEGDLEEEGGIERKETNDWQKAEATWTKMQEENIIPRERTLRMLADILKNNSQEVPFEVPETWYEQADTKQEVQPETNPIRTESSPEYSIQVLALCKKRKTKEALKILKDLNTRGVALNPSAYDHLIRTLLSEGAMEDALTVHNV
ncbi:Leucine-rich PPR motif-containing protein, mitochondrial [Collichthys lucidus]|uniref:Leucine-rich PPR motif-containing protein, mitochondrial n=1 Tax=Collichthys lucidus TaxID=240159 RepID=A0A4U5VCR3_COLLU|nr:Leucine-rich PPR motif-containing protein, mitochondrial [Collichthys lucidus]